MDINKKLFNYMEIASKNKLLLHLLRTIDAHNIYRFREEKKFVKYLNNLKTVANMLDGVEYAFIKLHKPVVYVPSDIDILVKKEETRNVINILSKEGFEIKIIEPYCITMGNSDTIVDIYIYPSFVGMIYIDTDLLLNHKEFIDYNGIKIPVLKKYAEALMTIAHAIYKERIYTLNDYITVRSWFSQESFNLANKLKVVNAVRKALTIHDKVNNKQIDLPYRIPLMEWLLLLIEKIFNDNLTKATLVLSLNILKDKRFGRLLFDKLLKETY